MKPHVLLGIAPNATKDEAKKAYKKLVKIHHPDTGGNEETFKQINEAYDNFVNPKPVPKPRVRHRPFGKNRSIKINYSITLEEVETGLDQDIYISLPNGKQKLVHLQIPPGVHNNQIVVFRGLGDDSNSRLQKGDLHVIIKTKQHKQFRRIGNNLQSQLQITKENAAEGCRLRIPSLQKEPYVLDIPKGIRHGQVIRYGGKGLPILNSNLRGDLLVNISVK